MQFYQKDKVNNLYCAYTIQTQYSTLHYNIMNAERFDLKHFIGKETDVRSICVKNAVETIIYTNLYEFNIYHVINNALCSYPVLHRFGSISLFVAKN